MRVSTKEQSKEKEELKDLLEQAKNSSGEITVFTILRNVSRSGMQRTIEPVIFIHGEPRWLGYSVSKLLDWPFDQAQEGVKVRGTGMDMGFHLIYTLSAVLYGYDDEGGYKLNQQWL